MLCVSTERNERYANSESKNKTNMYKQNESFFVFISFFFFSFHSWQSSAMLITYFDGP